MDNGTITFFDIEACGFYRLKQNPNDLDHKFGSLSEVIMDLKRWLENKTFEQTLPWDADTHPSRSKTYCRGIDIDEQTGDAIIVVYREVGDGSGNIHGVKLGSDVGPDASGTVVAGSEHDGETIAWGQPCYYWFIPEYNKLASISFTHSNTDTDRLCSYIRHYVNNNSNFGARKVSKQERVDPKNPDRMINIFKTTFPFGEGKDQCNCIFKLNAKELKIDALRADLDVLLSKVTHTIIRDTTTARTPDERNSFLKLGSDILPSLFGESPKTEQAKKVEVIIDGAPSKDEMYKIFDDLNDDSDWSNVGFRTNEAGGSTVWLKQYVVRASLLAEGNGKEHYSPGALIKEIKKCRSDLIAPLVKMKAEAMRKAVELEAEKRKETEPANQENESILRELKTAVGE